MSAIGPGDWVEKLVDGPFASAGTVSQVLRVLPDYECAPCNSCGDAGPVLEIPVKCEWGHNHWCVCGWRLIYRPKAEFIESLMQPAPELETV